MELSDFYKSTIIETRVSFGFSEFECDPNTITDQLCIEPDEVIRNDKEIINQLNSWSIESKTISKNVNKHLRELLEKLKGKADKFKKEFGTPSFSVLWKGNYLYAGSGPFYESDVIKGIADLGADLWQGIYQIEKIRDRLILEQSAIGSDNQTSCSTINNTEKPIVKRDGHGKPCGLVDCKLKI